ncbi:hypothetical protein TRFO_11544 [Tritrichomonas foetus]|uniref:Uncharacterized protein n=1 Tax=Tritrichomonas foetus TaxID=1144522 RepID=A0A1J4J6G4_9EUKA|nr:hypothetical protein TRFO_11544 [Tritrichomonas foetus]|eukprot:OHS93759.1 hypothetical protein TRFO_11544 [Tritrichomonas foetus]
MSQMIMNDLDDEYQNEFQNFKKTLNQFHILFKKFPNSPLMNQPGYIDFRTSIPESIQEKYCDITNKLIEFAHKKVLLAIDAVVSPCIPGIDNFNQNNSGNTSTSGNNINSHNNQNSNVSNSTNPEINHRDKISDTKSDKVSDKSSDILSNAINELAMSIFFSPFSISNVKLRDALKYTKYCYEYLLRRLVQYNYILNHEDNPFLSSILRLFTFTIILYGIVRNDQLDFFLSKTLNTKQCDNARLIYFHADQVFEYFSQILRTPNQYSVRFHSQIVETREKLDEMLKSMEDVFKDEFIAKPLNSEEGDDSDLSPICLTRPETYVRDATPPLTLKKLNEKCDNSVEYAHLDPVVSDMHQPTGEIALKLYLTARKPPNRRFYTILRH